jgi:peroxiredoxin
MVSSEMRRKFVLGVGLAAIAAQVRGLEIGSTLPDFTIRPLESPAFVFGEAVRTHRAVVVLFLSKVCPYSRYNAGHLRELNAELGRRGVLFISVNSNQTETAQEALTFAKKHGHDFPVVKDTHHAIADLLDARVTPEAFVIDTAGLLRYKGRIRSKIGSPDLKDAIKSVLEGQPVRVPVAKAFGCTIQRE